MRVKPLRSRGGRIARSPQANWGLEIWIGCVSLFSGRGARGSGRRRPCARGGTSAVRPPDEARTHRRATPCGLAQQESRPSRYATSEARGREDVKREEVQVLEIATLDPEVQAAIITACDSSNWVSTRLPRESFSRTGHRRQRNAELQDISTPRVEAVAGATGLSRAESSLQRPHRTITTHSGTLPEVGMVSPNSSLESS